MGIERNRPIEACERFLRPIQIDEDTATIRKGARVSRIERDRAIAGGQRLFQAFQLSQRDGAIVPGVASPAIEAERGLDTLERGRLIAALRCDHAQKMQTAKMPRLARTHL